MRKKLPQKENHLKNLYLKIFSNRVRREQAQILMVDVHPYTQMTHSVRREQAQILMVDVHPYTQMEYHLNS
jgi:hypothetical protein